MQRLALAAVPLTVVCVCVCWCVTADSSRLPRPAVSTSPFSTSASLFLPYFLIFQLKKKEKYWALKPKSLISYQTFDLASV